MNCQKKIQIKLKSPNIQQQNQKINFKVKLKSLTLPQITNFATNH
jgi:hypothetical protein